MIESKKVANPFPGLRPFETDEYGLFFGREGQSDALIERLQRSHFLAVVGTSGSGKSSLVRAGLLPALRGGMMAGAGSGWRIAIMRPGNDPIGNLAGALAEKDVLLEAGGGLPPAEALAVIEATLRRGALGLVDAARQARLQDHEKLLVVVDQFEELFRFRAARSVSSPGDDASAFVKLLLEASQQRELSIYVVPTMRSDFLGDCAQFQGLPEAINDGQYLIPRMTRDERRFAITGPVGVKRCKITEPLVNRLMNDVGDNPDQLPILQHALMRTWDYWAVHRRNGEPISLEHYEAVGTMADALSKHADEAFDELPDERSRYVAEALFKALTERGADNRELRRPTCLKDICTIAGANAAEISAVVEIFRAVGRSFLMPPVGVVLEPETVIDISHESLIRNWERLKVWARDEAEAARIYRRLAVAAADYRAGIGGLLDEVTLRYALKWREKYKPNHAWGARYHPEYFESIAYLEVSQAASDAAQAAREHEQKEKIERERRELETAKAFAVKQALSAQRMRRLTVALCLLLLFALGALVVAARARANALRNRAQTEAALQRNGLIRQGLEALGRDHSGEALKSFDCLSQNLQALLPNAPHLAPWTTEPCSQSATEDTGQLEVQLAWAYSNLGSTFSSIAGNLPPDISSSESEEATTNTDEPSQKQLYSRALDAYEQAVKILEPLVGTGKVKDESPDLLNAYQGVGRAYHNVALTGYEPPPGVQKETIPPDAYFQKADKTFLSVLRIQERHLDKDPADAAVQHLNLARLYHDMKNDDEAEKNFLKAVELWDKSVRLKSVLGDVSEEDSSNQEILVLRQLAEFYSNLNNLPAAESTYDRIIDIQENYDVSKAEDLADSYSELSQIYQAENKVDKALAAIQLANVLPKVALKSRRHEDESLCLDMFKVAPIYFKLNRYLQAKQAYDIAIEKGSCMQKKEGEAESLLNRALGQLATSNADPARTWQDEDGIYQTLLHLQHTGNDAHQLVSRRLKNMARRFGEVTKQPAAAPDEQFIATYMESLFFIADSAGGNTDDVEAAYRLALNALNLVKDSTQPSVLDTCAGLLERYGTFLDDHQQPDEAAKMKGAVKDLREKQAALEKKRDAGH
jgi:hypothetical protein